MPGIAGWLVRASVGLLVLVSPALASAGCDVVRIRQRHLDASFDRIGMDRARFEGAGVTLTYREGGTGPAVVLLHGFGAEAVWQWEPQARALVRGHRVVVPDLLWFGGSVGPAGAFTLDDQARAVGALLDHLGEERVDLVGMSYGGMVAWRFATLWPERLRRLVLVASPGPVYRAEDLETFRSRFGAEDVAEVFVPDDPGRVQDLIDLAYRRPPRAPRFALRQVIRHHYDPRRAELSALLRALEAHLAAGLPQAPLTGVPVLLLWGRDDPVFPLAIAERLRASLGGEVRLEVLEGARHLPNLEHPRRFNRALLSFLDGS